MRRQIRRVEVSEVNTYLLSTVISQGCRYHSMGIEQSLQRVVLRNWYQNTKQNKTKQKERNKEIKKKRI